MSSLGARLPSKSLGATAGTVNTQGDGPAELPTTLLAVSNENLSIQPAVAGSLGWREWVGLPEWGVSALKAKVDTGAKTSALHAFDLEMETIDGELWAFFEIHPEQRETSGAVRASAPVVGFRSVRSSSGHEQERPVVATRVTVGDQTWRIEVTLTSRDEMGFRMLLGREALKERFVVDPGGSYLAGEPVPAPEVVDDAGDRSDGDDSTSDR